MSHPVTASVRHSSTRTHDTTLLPASIDTLNGSESHDFRLWLFGGEGSSRLKKEVVSGLRASGEHIKPTIFIALGEAYASRHTLFLDTSGLHMIGLIALLSRCFQFAVSPRGQRIKYLKEAASELRESHTHLMRYLDRAKLVGVFGAIPLAADLSVRKRGYKRIGVQLQGQDPLDRFHIAFEGFWGVALNHCG